MTATAPGFVAWLTGLPAAGKTSLALAMKRQLAARAIQTLVLDSDELRRMLTPEPTYSDEERDWFYGVMGQLAAWLAGNGINVLVAATANRRRYRDALRSRVEHFAEVYVYCTLEVCQERDPKSIYARASDGLAGRVPGVDADYEAPSAPEVTIDTRRYFPADGARLVIKQLQAQGIIGGAEHDTPQAITTRKPLPAL